jgi:hypothetical protein
LQQYTALFYLVVPPFFFLLSMRSFCVWLLLLSALGLSECSAPPAEPSSTFSPVAVPAHNSVSFGIATVWVPGPDPNHQRVQAEDIWSADTVYAATLPVLNEADGSVRIRVTVNPRVHTLEKMSVLFAPHQPTVTYKQVGQGVGRYEPTTGHYYFVTVYQKMRKLADGRTDYGSIQHIGGWVKPGSSTAAVAHKGSSK